MSLKKKLAASLATISLVGALVGGATFAYLTDTESSAANFTAGKVDLAVQPELACPDITCALPGQEGFYRVTLTNTACADLFWKVSSATAVSDPNSDLDDKITVWLTDTAGAPITSPEKLTKADATGANGGSKVVLVNWKIDPLAGNEIAGDKAQIKVNFDAVQGDYVDQTNPFNGVTIKDAEAPDQWITP